jgi:hypothetical protein
MKQHANQHLSRLLILRPHPWTYHPVAPPAAFGAPAKSGVTDPRPIRRGREREHSVRVEPQVRANWRDFLPRL